MRAFSIELGICLMVTNSTISQVVTILNDFIAYHRRGSCMSKWTNYQHLCLYNSKFGREVHAFKCWLTCSLQELRNKGKSQWVIHKSGCSRLREQSLTQAFITEFKWQFNHGFTVFVVTRAVVAYGSGCRENFDCIIECWIPIFLCWIASSPCRTFDLPEATNSLCFQFRWKKKIIWLFPMTWNLSLPEDRDDKLVCPRITG